MLNSNEAYQARNLSLKSSTVRDMTPASMVRLMLLSMCDEIQQKDHDHPISEPVYDYINKANKLQIKQILYAATARLDALQPSRAV